MGDWGEDLLTQAKAHRKLTPREVVGDGGTQITSKDHGRQQNGADYHRPSFKGSGENYRDHYQEGPGDHLDGWALWCGSLGHGGSILTDAHACSELFPFQSTPPRSMRLESSSRFD